MQNSVLDARADRARECGQKYGSFSRLALNSAIRAEKLPPSANFML